MIPLVLRLEADADQPFVTRLAENHAVAGEWDSTLIEADEQSCVFAGPFGLFELQGANSRDLLGDVLLVRPADGQAERLIRATSPHNTLLVTERCDQLCLMCSQPPKKTHNDRFAYLEQSCILAPEGAMIGITGGEPTLYKEEVLGMIERVLKERSDLGFHVLSNAQHFDADDVKRLRQPLFDRVVWGIPLYSHEASTHDSIVAKPGAFERLHRSLHTLLLAGARVELRTVLMSQNASHLTRLAEHLTRRLRFIEVWSLMQLEHIGFAKNRWPQLYHDHTDDFSLVGTAIDQIELHGMAARLFNFPRCSIPPAYRELAVPSISDWKKKFMPGCGECREQDLCSGFFEWHPDDHGSAKVSAL